MILQPGPGIAVTLCRPIEPSAIERADLCEIRADLWAGPPVEALAFMEQAAKPVIFTCRAASEGGAFRGTDADRLSLFGRAVEGGAFLIDIEAASPLALPAIRAGWPVLLSIHDFSRPIPSLSARLGEIARSGARAAKLVSTAQRFEDLCEIRSILAEASPIPAVAFAMGDLGLPSRILALAWGSFLTYVAAEAAVAPGQLTLSDFIATYGPRGPQAGHLALTGPPGCAQLLLAIARNANSQEDPSRSPRARIPVVPYPEVRAEDLAAAMPRVGASALIDFGQDRAGEFTFSAYLGPGERIAVEIARGASRVPCAFERLREAVAAASC